MRRCFPRVALTVSGSSSSLQRTVRAVLDQLVAVRSVIQFIVTHPANEGRRIRQLGRAVRFQVSSRLGRPTIARLGPSARMEVPRHAQSASKVLYANPPDYHEMMAWRRIIRPGDVFVDVGANVGTYSLWAGDHGARVLAFEPHPVAATRLRTNVAMNDFPIAVYEAALGEKAGALALTEDLESTNHLDFTHSSGSIPIAVLTLDEVIRDQGDFLMKIDVEGAEELVLRGATDALVNRRIRVMQLEWNSLSETLLGRSRSELADLLRTYGYHFSRPDVSGRLLPCDPSSSSSEDVFVTRDPV